MHTIRHHVIIQKCTHEIVRYATILIAAYPVYAYYR